MTLVGIIGREGRHVTDTDAVEQDDGIMLYEIRVTMDIST